MNFICLLIPLGPMELSCCAFSLLLNLQNHNPVILPSVLHRYGSSCTRIQSTAPQVPHRCGFTIYPLCWS
eukprot:jgi/Botrbrau1/1840/Bobra.146_1s0034.1